MPQNNFGVETATMRPGVKSPLNFGIAPDQVTVTGGIGSGTSFPGQAPDMSQFGGALDNVNVPNFDASSLDTPSFDFGTGSGSGSSLLSSAISTLTGGSGLGNLAAIGGEAAAAAYGLSEAKAAQQKAEQQAQQIMGPANQYLNSSQQLLQQYFNQTLNPNDQKFVDFATKEGQDIINSGQGMKSIADQQLGQFAKGQLLSADQLELDRNTAAAKQQIADNMAKSGTSDSSIAAGYNQQIDEAAQIQKQKVLNGYFQTGNQAYNSWLTSTTQGAQLMQQGATFSHQAFQDMLSSSLSLGTVGMSGLTTAIGLEIQSDNELGKSVSELMANLASAFAYTVAGGGGGGGSGGGSGGGGGGGGILQYLLNMGKGANNIYNQASSAFNTGSALSSASGFSDVASGLDASTAATEASDFSSIMSGFNSAGGGAAASSLTPDVLGQFSFAPAMEGVGVSGVSELGSVRDAVNAASAGGDATSAASSASSASSGFSAAQGLGAVGAGLSLYNEINSWQSGATGQDALSGAETGAAIGTIIMPGIGTAIGAVGGAIAGGISSLFGGGKVDPENASFENYTQAFNKATPQQKPQVAAAVKNPYVALAGYFDLRSGQMKGQNPIYQKYGRMGEQKFTNDLVGKVQTAQKTGVKDPKQMWSQVVQPWLNSFGTWQDSNKDAMTALVGNMTSQIMNGNYKQNFKAIGGDTVFK